MKNKPGILALVCLTYFFNLSSTLAQVSLNYGVSELPNKTKTTYDNVKYTIADEDHIYLFSGKGIYLRGNIKLYRVGDNLQLEKEASIKLNQSGSKLFYSSSFIMGNIIYILCYDPVSATQLDVYCQMVDKATLSIKGTPLKIGSSRYETVSSYYPESMFMVRSEDESKLLIGFSTLDETKVKEVLELHCLDRNLQKIYSKTMQGKKSSGIGKLWNGTDHLASMVSILPMMLDNDGNFFIGFLNLKIDLCEVPNESSEWVHYPISIHSKPITSVLFESTETSNEFLISGSYRSPADVGNLGVFRAVIDKNTKDLKQSSSSELNVAESFEDLGIVGEEGLNPESLLGDPKGNYKVEWQGIHYNSDGSGIFYGEKINPLSRTRTTTTTYGGTRNTTTSSHTYEIDNYYDILVVGFDKNDEIIWNRVVPRKQEIPVRGIEGMHYFADEAGATYVVYNENPKNLDSKPSEEVRNLGLFGNEVAIVKINQKGQAVRQSLEGEIKDLKGTIFPSLCISNELGSTTLFFKRKSDSRLVHLDVSK